MGLEVTTIAQTLQLTTLARFRRAFGGGLSTTEETAVGNLIRDVSASIANYCGRTFARQAYTESVAGFGGLQLMLGQAPAVVVSAIVGRNSQIITDYGIESKDEGRLYRRLGWEWTVQMFEGLTGSQRLFDYGTPMPGREETAYTIDYVAGYVLPSQYIEDVDGLSASAVDNSFNDAQSRFPALLKAGDVVETIGFTGSNSGRFKVAGTPTTSKIVVAATLSTDAAAAGRSILFLPPAECRPFDDVEQAAFEGVKVALLDAQRDTRVTLRRTSQTEIEYSGSDDEISAQYGLPARAVGLLKPWVRRS